MPKFNKNKARKAAVSPIRAFASGATYEGAPGFARDDRSELFLLAVANMVGEDTFYERAGDRDQRFERLIASVAVADPAWTGRLLGWLRTEANLRSAALVGALEASRALVAAGQPGSRALVTSVLQRADEPGEALAYWISRHGRAVPKAVKRGIGDAARRLYTEFTLLKYDTDANGFRFGDVLDLTHPRPATDEQGALFKVALDRRHRRADAVVPEALATLTANARLRREAAADPTVLLDADRLRLAGMTWEDALSLAGSTVDKSALWSALIPSMGYMALVRNLRNFDQAGVPDRITEQVARRIANPEQVARSRQFPFRFLAAHRATQSLRWGFALERALDASLSNVPVLPGRTLILVDLSGSMGCSAGGRHSDLSRADVAKVFGAALAMRTDPTLVWFDTGSGAVKVPRGGSLLRLVDSFPRGGGGTNTAQAVDRWYAGHDRVVIVTDEQAAFGGADQRRLGGGRSDVTAGVPQRVPVYTWNLAGYRRGHAPSGEGTRHAFGGLSDAAFRLIPLLERDGRASWPF